MSKFTAAQLVEFYQKVVDGGEMSLKRSGNVTTFQEDNICGPNLTSYSEIWSIKPAKKLIDLQYFIHSGIDMEFCDYGQDSYIVGPLGEIDTMHPHNQPYNYIPEMDSNTVYQCCGPRMNYIHFHDGGDCPLPEGFMVMPIYRDSALSVLPVHASEEIWVSCNLPYDFIGYEILGLADGWEYPWEA